LGQLFGPSDFGAALFIKGYKRIGPYNAEMVGMSDQCDEASRLFRYKLALLF